MKTVGLATLALMVTVVVFPAATGRVLLGLGLPGLAQRLMTDADWRGIAAAHAGDHPVARADLAQARAWLNLGNLEARAGRYAAALEAYDRGRAQGDPAASANFDLLRAYYAALGLAAETPIPMRSDTPEGATASSFVARGNARAAGQGVGVTNVQTSIGLPELKSDGLRQVRKIFDDAFVVADARWLQTLEDSPGKFLAARLKAEQKRRRAEAAR